MAGPSPKRRYERTAYVHRVTMVGRVCRRMEGGESLPAICRCPTMPAYTTFMSWLARHPELREQVEAVRAAYPDLHGRRAYHYWSEELAEELLQRIAAGRSLVEVCAEGDMPVHASVTRWLKERPEFAEGYRRAREAQAEALFDLAWRIACEAQEAEWRTAKLKIDTLKWRVARLAPQKYGTWKALPAPVEAAAAKPVQPPRVEARHFALAPDGVKDITVLARGLDAEALNALHEDIRAGRLVVAAEAELAPDEHIEGCFLVKGGAAAR
jgi:hypothetical protein